MATNIEDLTTGGVIRPITRWGTPVMHRECERVESFDAELRELVRDMFATLDAATGVGLAANQIGVDLQVFIYDCPDDDGTIHRGVVCNPTVELPGVKERRLVAVDEGCLSLPGAYQSLSRPDHAICRGQNIDGEDIEIVGHGFFARCLQHETDHLHGTVFGDRLSARARRKLYAQHEAIAERYLEDWPVSPKQAAN